MATTTNLYKVKLQNANVASELVKFDVSPEFSENRSVNYAPLEPVHSPGQIFIYKNTASRTFELGDVKLISRSMIEATTNMAKLQMIRSWTLPWFGAGSSSTSNSSATTSSSGSTGTETESKVAGTEIKQEDLDSKASSSSFTFTDTAQKALGNTSDIITGLGSTATKATTELLSTKSAIGSAASTTTAGTNTTANSASTTLDNAAASSAVGQGVEQLGAPPAILLLSAYSSSNNSGTYANIRKVPTVIVNLGINYPTDVDYIPTAYGEPFPTVMSISISLQETHAPVEFEAFSLSSFKQGALEGF